VAYRVEFTTDAEEDLRGVESTRARALIRRAIARLEREGPCIGLRLRGAARGRFCRLSVPEHAQNTWRIVYEWPPTADEPNDLIWIWVVREHTEQPETDVYRWLDVLVARRGVALEPWSATEPRRRCCEDYEVAKRPTIDALSVHIQRRSRAWVRGSSANVIRKHRDAR
jgi:hypothetical protein